MEWSMRKAEYRGKTDAGSSLEIGFEPEPYGFWRWSVCTNSENSAARGYESTEFEAKWTAEKVLSILEEGETRAKVVKP